MSTSRLKASARFCRLLRNYVSKNTRNSHAEAKIYGIISHRKKKYRASRGEMTVDNTSLLVALKQKPHPSDAGSKVVREREGKREAEGMKNGKRENEKVF